VLFYFPSIQNQIRQNKNYFFAFFEVEYQKPVASFGGSNWLKRGLKHTLVSHGEVALFCNNEVV
jgi:hypothetical protein